MISRYESADRFPRLENLDALARALGTSGEELVGIRHGEQPTERAEALTRLDAAIREKSPSVIDLLTLIAPPLPPDL